MFGKMFRKFYLAVFCVSLILDWTLALTAQTPISVYPDPIQFGTVPLNSPSFTLGIYLSNTTTSAVDITGITISGTNSSDFVLGSPACVGAIAGDSYCEMTMNFTPSAMGNLTASLLIAVNGVSSLPSVFPSQALAAIPSP